MKRIRDGKYVDEISKECEMVGELCSFGIQREKNEECNK